ncbi:epoxide hydrolase [Fusarium albosuccineum]|uniref:Epoxide hydrolase n=1 Tax=Fusarium albosuccineum TaxID=1237068 RepID=A0A8H4LMX4_9HYPO|nr:epoxide hydrolase [Fusarium albosuccineum]
MAPIRSYTICVAEEKIQDLKERLRLAKFPPPSVLTDSWDYGAPVSDVKRLAARWCDGYDWRAAEAKLNELPHFMTQIPVDGYGELDIHFIHQKGQAENSIPLLFCHGWPGSFFEVIKILPLLTAEKDGLSFTVVAPSLPNFGFSSGPDKPGFGMPQYAETLHKLMLELGHNQYVTQGGDWGFFITRFMGIQYPKHCLASHLNYLRAHPPSLFRTPWQFSRYLLPRTKAEKEGLARCQWFEGEGFGYCIQQSTRPTTVGLAWADSPVALLSWIYEKLHDWTDNYPWEDDEILTWISIFQFSTAGSEASARIYFEMEHPEPSQQHLDWVPDVKLGLSYFPRDLIVLPKCYGRTLGPVVFENVHERGGHFAAHELPEELVEDVREMFSRGGGAFDVTKRLQEMAVADSL